MVGAPREHHGDQLVACDPGRAPQRPRDLSRGGSYKVGTEATDTSDEHARSDGRANAAASAIDRVVDQYFAHPADCRGKWQAPFLAALTAASPDALELKRELARRIALPPNEQAPNDEATIAHADRHGKHGHGDYDPGDQHRHDAGAHRPDRPRAP